MPHCNWEEFAAFVEPHDSVLVLSHRRPDGDAIGCSLALRDYCRSLGKQAEAANPSTYPERYTFLDPQRELISFRDNPDQFKQVFSGADAIAIVDTGAWEQLEPLTEMLQQSKAPRVCIDHHLKQNEDVADLMLVNSNIEACGSMIMDLIETLDGEISPAMAQWLFIAIATDTGWFRFSSTTPETYRRAARLVEHGADPVDVYWHLYESNRLGRLKLMARCLDRLTVGVQGRLAHSVIFTRDFEETGAVPPETEDLVNYMISIEGTEVGLLFIEQASGEVKCSLRSRTIDVSELASHFKGGGHRAAAGATLDGPVGVAVSRMIEAASERMKGKK